MGIPLGLTQAADGDAQASQTIHIAAAHTAAAAVAAAFAIRKP